ncbi:hypothetical protein HanXRQr2_Chr16g0725571 [Helianthus annuus]|uniref:Uncharacterized protein n=1 Tax=Helianthus annuus TaxID=4232 RepID=A0A9K3GWL4_HELAN|nr:hypothetical protein HanXRQr2_Chr16g0725571 [Helianthus annuus]KAJ0901812.1 hypothetical protein HanPSC8_Chr08g0329661 [Helianthus annuus]
MDLLFSLLNTQSWDFWSWCTWVAYYRILIPSLACFFWLWGVALEGSKQMLPIEDADTSSESKELAGCLNGNGGPTPAVGKDQKDNQKTECTSRVQFRSVT